MDAWLGICGFLKMLVQRVPHPCHLPCGLDFPCPVFLKRKSSTILVEKY
ncbi:hypothetical protein BofuT4_uP046050.1 [Botrytis cinerea T4]|uniref:Uncharacterized protein n=1 Tax=Botryotinia fuckeliana (strain T4) TaxID=999810 RepID=G2XYQ0_BOTF4|nr:hypothetical protein BofuT4_uP046050.1 [Botrytis cinerea T4]